jgi:hypothetical protein
MVFAWNKTAASIFCSAILLAGCKGGADSDTNQTIQILGRVIDGPIQDAWICIDSNANKRCDASEPGAYSGQDGRFRFAAEVSTNSDDPWVLIAEVDANQAKDSDDAGQSLAQAGKPSVVMQGLAVNQSDVVISPLTTLVVNEMEVRGLSREEASRTVMATLRLPLATPYDLDFSSPANPDEIAIKQAAQVVFLAIGRIKDGLERGDHDQPGNLLTKAAWMEALPVSGYLLNQLWPLDGLDNLVQTVQTALTPIADDYVETYLARSVLLNAKARLAPATAVLGHSFQLSRDIGPGEFDLTCCYFSTGSLGFSEKMDYNRKSYVDGVWRTQPGGLHSYFDFNVSNGAWAQRPISGVLGSLTGWSEGTALLSYGHSGNVTKLHLREADLSGHSLADVPELVSAVNQYLGAKDPTSLRFPTGTRLIFMSETPQTDQYALTAGGVVAGGRSPPPSFDHLDSMMAYAMTPETPPTVPGTLAHIAAGVFAITFDTAGPTGNLTFWDAKTVHNPQGGTQILGKGRFEMRRLMGQNLLVISHAPSAAIAYGCTTCLPPASNERIIFAVRDGIVSSGTLTLAEYARTPGLWPNGRLWLDRGYTPMLNGAAWDALNAWVQSEI